MPMRPNASENSRDHAARAASNVEYNTTIAPVNTPETLAEDPQFIERLGFMPHETHGADMEPYPVKFVGETPVDPTPAPTVGEHTDEILTEVLGYDSAKIDALRGANALGEGR